MRDGREDGGFGGLREGSSILGVNRDPGRIFVIVSVVVVVRRGEEMVGEVTVAVDEEEVEQVPVALAAMEEDEEVGVKRTEAGGNGGKDGRGDSRRGSV